MPRIPDASSLGERRIPVGRSVAYQDDSAEIMAGAIGNAARQIGGAVTQFADHRDEFRVAKAGAEFSKLESAARNFEDNDWETYEERYRKTLTQAKEGILKNIKLPRNREALSLELDSAIERGAGAVKGVARAKEVEFGRADLSASLESFREAALAAGDEESRTANIKGAQMMIKSALDNRYIDPTDAERINKEYTRSYAEGFLSMKPSDKQIELLTNPSASDAQMLSFIPLDKRSALLEKAQRENIVTEDRQYQVAERGRKKIADEFSKEGDQLLFSGELTPQWIEQNRRSMDPADVRFFYQKLGGGGSDDGPRDPMRYVELRDAAGRGTDVRDDARDALRKGQIRTSDYDRIIGEVEQSRPTWYRRGSEYISTSAAVSDLNPDPAAAQRKASMLDDWNDWANENQKATEQDAQNAYQRIVKEYAIVDYGKMALMKRAPQFLSGTRNVPDFDATEMATVRAFNEQRITREEFERQAKLIKEWRDAFNKTQAK